MIGRSLRKLVSLLFIVLGAMFLAGSIDITPVIGSPQVDYPAFDYRLPFWPQLALVWLVMGVGGGLLAALGILGWSNEPVRPPSLQRAAVVAGLLFGFVGGLRLAEFFAFGTMGPLHVQQPTFRFAVTQGLISAAVVTSEWIIASLALARADSRAPWIRSLVALIGAGLGFFAAMLVIAAATGLPLQSTLVSWSPVILILASVAALLVALTRRHDEVTL